MAPLTPYFKPVIGIVACLFAFKANGAAFETKAVPSSLPLLAKRVSSQSPNGKTRTSECLVHPDGVTVENSVDGIRFTLERVAKIDSRITLRIDEAAAEKATPTQRSPLAMSYSYVAFRPSPSGIQETVVLSSFDGKTGIELSNPAPAAHSLKEIANTLCN